MAVKTGTMKPAHTRQVMSTPPWSLRTGCSRPTPSLSTARDQGRALNGRNYVVDEQGMLSTPSCHHRLTLFPPAHRGETFFVSGIVCRVD